MRSPAVATRPAASRCAGASSGRRGVRTPRRDAINSTTTGRAKAAQASHAMTVSVPISRFPSSGRLSASMTPPNDGTDDGTRIGATAARAMGTPMTKPAMPTVASSPRMTSVPLRRAASWTRFSTACFMSHLR